MMIKGKRVTKMTFYKDLIECFNTYTSMRISDINNIRRNKINESDYIQNQLLMSYVIATMDHRL